MKAVIILFGIFISCSIAIKTGSLPESVKNGYFDGRSGNVILKPAAIQPGSDAYAILIDESNEIITKTATPSVTSTHIADVISRSLGVFSPNPSFNPDYVRNDLFNRARANILFNIESVGQDSLPQLTNLNKIASENINMKITDDSYPSSPVSLATTIATGKYPSQHGIVSNAWKAKNGDEISAFSNSDSNSKRSNTADILIQTFEGKSFTLSASSSKLHSSAHCVNPAVEISHPNSYCVYYKEGTGFVSSPSSSLSSSTESLLASLSTTRLFSSSHASLSYSSQSKTVSVTYPIDNQDHTVTFNLNNQEVLEFFLELMYAENLNKQISSSFSSQLNDDYPDSYSFTLSSLTKILEKYGRSSPEFLSSLYLVDTAVGKIITQLSSLYPGRAVVEIVLLGSHPSSRASFDTRTVSSQLNRLLPQQNDVTHYYPNLYVTDSDSNTNNVNDLSNICHILSIEMEQSGVNVYCPSYSDSSLLATSELLGMHTMATTSYNSSTIRIANYQITLWISITLVLTVLAVIYSLAFMSFKKDTLLYSTFNPNWEERKRK